MMYVFKETYNSASDIPVAIRKWLIERWNLQKEKEQKARNPEPDVNSPLTSKEKERLKKNNR